MFKLKVLETENTYTLTYKINGRIVTTIEKNDATIETGIILPGGARRYTWCKPISEELALHFLLKES